MYYRITSKSTRIYSTEMRKLFDTGTGTTTDGKVITSGCIKISEDTLKKIKKNKITKPIKAQ